MCVKFLNNFLKDRGVSIWIGLKIDDRFFHNLCRNLPKIVEMLIEYNLFY